MHIKNTETSGQKLQANSITGTYTKQCRSDSDVKNHFYAVIRKCLRRMSKMFGQKNSTQKIKNIKPTVLSRLLEDKSDSMAKCNNLYKIESSEALFKFIFDK